MTNITIDIGNSFIKMAVFEKGSISVVYTESSIKMIGHHLEKFERACIIWCSVKNMDDDISHLLQNDSKSHQHLIFKHDTPSPLRNHYETPETLGLDRLAVSVGAGTLFPKSDVLVIDAGTCITYDIVTASKGYLGGSISPGIQIRYKSLHNHTAKLPLLNDIRPSNLTGQNTYEAIHSGVINGVLAEIEGIKYRYSKVYPNLKCVACGGDAEFICKQFHDQQILLEKNLVHLGLQAVLAYNNL